MLLNDIFSKIESKGEGEFSIRELFPEADWIRYSVQERRGAGHAVFNPIKKGQFNKDGWIVEPLSPSKPQRYRKRRERVIPLSSTRVFLNEIPGIEQTVFKDWVKILEANGKWIEIVEKPK